MDRRGMLDTWKSEAYIIQERGKSFNTTPIRTKGLQKINPLMSLAEMKQFSALITKEQLTAVQARTTIFCQCTNILEQTGIAISTAIHNLLENSSVDQTGALKYLQQQILFCL
jgi:hypothetical protein